MSAWQHKREQNSDMRIEVDNASYDAVAENTVVYIGNTLLNSIYTDLDEDYSVIPAIPSKGYAQLVIELQRQGVPIERVTEYDPTAEPYVYIINGLCRAFRSELDVLKV